jgi:hypothetical protein
MEDVLKNNSKWIVSANHWVDLNQKLNLSSTNQLNQTYEGLNLRQQPWKINSMEDDIHGR